MLRKFRKQSKNAVLRSVFQEYEEYIKDLELNT